MKMKILIACEFSGIVRDAFIEKGHNAVSCDFLPSERPGPHIQGDVRAILDDGWDMMIAFPPCTYLSNVGNRWLNEERYGEDARDRKRKRELALEFVKMLWRAPINRICIENPVGYLSSKTEAGAYRFRKVDQVVHPYNFGDGEWKKTCLWLKNLTLLPHHHPPHSKPDPKYIMKSGKRAYSHDLHGWKKDREKIRSRTFPGIASAMAAQWG